MDMSSATLFVAEVRWHMPTWAHPWKLRVMTIDGSMVRLYAAWWLYGLAVADFGVHEFVATIDTERSSAECAQAIADKLGEYCMTHQLHTAFQDAPGDVTV